MTLRLTDDEQAALRDQAEAEGVSMQEAARRAIREYVARRAHQERVTAAADLISAVHADALDAEPSSFWREGRWRVSARGQRQRRSRSPRRARR